MSFWFSSASGLLVFDGRGIAKAIMAPGATQMQFPSTSEGMLILPQCSLFHPHALENKDGCIMPGSSSVKRFQSTVLQDDGCFFIVLSAQFSLKLREVEVRTKDD